MDKDDKYIARTERMITRWSGKRLPVTRKQTTEGEVIRHTPPAVGELDSEQGHYIEPARALPVLDQCDVLVVGAGPAGLSAALAAKRAGADTIILERFGCFGGVITTVGMETLAWYRYEGTIESEGIGVEMERIAAQMGGAIKWPYNDSQCLDADFFKVVADRLITEAGVRPILHCMAVDVIFEEGSNRLKGIITESKSGRQVVLAKRIIDCTGDADIAHLAGASYRKTPKDKMLGVTTVFNASGVDKQKFLQYTEDQPATYADWSRTWDQETTGKEDDAAMLRKAMDANLTFTTAAASGVTFPQATQIVYTANAETYYITNTVVVSNSLDYAITGLAANNVKVRYLAMFLSATNEAAVSRRATFGIFTRPDRLCDSAIYADTNQLYWAAPSTSAQAAGATTGTVADASGVVVMDRYAVGNGARFDFLTATNATATTIFWGCTNKYATTADANTKISHANYLTPTFYDDDSAQNSMWCRFAWATPYTGTVTTIVRYGR